MFVPLGRRGAQALLPALLPAGSTLLPGRPLNAETILRTPEVTPQFRGGEEIDLSQFWHHALRSFGHGSETQRADTEPRPEGAGCGLTSNSTTSGVRSLGACRHEYPRHVCRCNVILARFLKIEFIDLDQRAQAATTTSICRTSAGLGARAAYSSDLLRRRQSLSPMEYGRSERG